MMTEQPPEVPAQAAWEPQPDLLGLAETQMLSVDARRVVLIGTLVFAIAAIVLLPFWSWLGTHGHRVWFWTCVVGAGLGLISLPLVARHRRMGRLGEDPIRR